MTGPELVAGYPCLVSVITAVRTETDALPLTWSLLHTTPATGAIIHDDSTGVTGFIDWAGARRGPVLYDVAYAVRYFGGRHHAFHFLSAYQSEGPLAKSEMTRLRASRRFREVVQSAYFAGRFATNNLAESRFVPQGIPYGLGDPDLFRHSNWSLLGRVGPGRPLAMFQPGSTRWGSR
jgi:Ser/Thr protein kinase RdoA (MazF antagonist)